MKKFFIKGLSLLSLTGVLALASAASADSYSEDFQNNATDVHVNYQTSEQETPAGSGHWVYTITQVSFTESIKDGSSNDWNLVTLTNYCGYIGQGATPTVYQCNLATQSPPAKGCTIFNVAAGSSDEGNDAGNYVCTPHLSLARPCPQNNQSCGDDYKWLDWSDGSNVHDKVFGWN